MIHRYAFFHGGIHSDKDGGYCLSAEVLGPGTWLWAVEQMKTGKIVQNKTNPGVTKYRMSTDGQGRIEWADTASPFSNWRSARLFISDFECANWEVLN